MAANNFFGYAAHSQATTGAGVYNAGVAPPPPTAYPTVAAAAAGVAVTPSVAVAAQPPQVPAGSVAASQFVAQTQPAAPPPQPPGGPAFRPGTALIALTAYQQQPGVNPATYVMAPPTASASPIVTPTSVYPTSTYHPYPPPQATPVAAAAAPVQVYDANTKTSYYAQPPVSSVAPVTYALVEAHYQARPTYSASSNPPMSRPQQNDMRVSYTYGQPPTSCYSYGGPTAASAPPPLKSNMYSLRPSVSSVAPNSTYGIHGSTLNTLVRGPTPQAVRPVKPPKPPPKPQQLHYCEVCKISCAGPQTYKEHLEGQKHKKKAAMATPTTGNSGGGPVNSATPKVGNALRCELCDVTCTGSDAYAAHIRGAKHQKVIKLHTRLGKPIPSVDPVVVTAASKNNSDENNSGKNSAKNAVPKINIVSMAKANDKNTLKTSNGQTEVNIPLLPDEKVVQPVGFDYIEEVKNDEGKVVSFRCKLCECKFNDPNAKEMHMKGRRHRLQYKKKVNPDLVVDLKPSLRQRRLADERAKRSMAKEDFWRRREEEFRMMEEDEKSMLWGNMPCMQANAPNHVQPPMMMRRPDSSDDRHVIAKHGQIYPTDEQLASIQKQVSIVERGLKTVSDSLDSDLKLKGVMRVGPLAKGLLLRSDAQVQLVLLASEVPTTSLLQTIATKLQSFLSTKSELADSFSVTSNQEKARIEVKANAGSSICVHVGITSPTVRASDDESKFSDDSLPKDRCLEHLADIRHAKWFGARAAGLQSSVMILRILRDLQAWSPHWKSLKNFALELIVEKSLASVGLPLSPGDALRRVFEAISGGCVLNGSPGLLDPCEKEAKDAIENLTNQEKEDLTSDAQKSLRLIAFRQIHQVLRMDPLPVTKFAGKLRIEKLRKRPAQNDGGSVTTNGNSNGSGPTSAKMAKTSE